MEAAEEKKRTRPSRSVERTVEEYKLRRPLESASQEKRIQLVIFEKKIEKNTLLERTFIIGESRKTLSSCSPLQFTSRHQLPFGTEAGGSSICNVHSSENLVLSWCVRFLALHLTRFILDFLRQKNLIG